MKRKQLEDLTRSHDMKLRRQGEDLTRSFILKVLQTKTHNSTAARLSGLIRNKDWPAALDVADSLSQQKYVTASEHYDANQLSYLLRKYPWSHPDLKPDDMARAKFKAGEERLREMNTRGFDAPEMANIMQRMRSFIAYVLGESPDVSILLEGDFGPGAAIGTHGDATNLLRKIEGDWTVTPGAYRYAIWSLLRNHHYSERLYDSVRGIACLDPSIAEQRAMEKMNVVRYNKIAFVPKTAKTSRSIAVEPLWNTYLQKGVDKDLRKRLKRIGIDLSNQERNQAAARRGSMYDSEDEAVTIDLANASNSISVELVRAVLPPDWFSLLDSLRSQYYLDGDKETRYEMFASMGNGFCFPLETLLFAAACHASQCGEPGKDFLVYGDDIVIRKVHAVMAIRTLEYIGFDTNTDKTFVDGPFRESCGADWFNGENVRPLVLDEPLDSAERIQQLHNAIKSNPRWEAWFGQSSLDFLKGLVPIEQRCVAPYKGCGNGAFWVEMDEFMLSPFAMFRRGVWTWFSVATQPVIDSRHGCSGEVWNLRRFHATLRAGCYLREPFTLRRKTKTKIRREAYGGASANWLPAAQLTMIDELRAKFYAGLMCPV